MRLTQYIKDTQGEMKHVSWPTRYQATAYTILVIVISLAIAAYLGLFDWLFTSGLDAIISNSESNFDPSELIQEEGIDADVSDISTEGEGNIKITPIDKEDLSF